MNPLIALSSIALAVVATSFISGILGMAGGMILMGVLLAFLPVPTAMMAHGITQMAANGWRAWMWRQSIDWRIFRDNVYGALAVLAFFSALQLVVSRPVVYVALGLTPFVSYVLPASLVLNVDRRGHAFACGVACNALSLLAGVSGPLLAVFFLPSKLDRRGVVATKAASQTFSHIAKIAYFGFLLAREHGRVEWWFAALMVVLAVAGTGLSRKALDAISDKDFRLWTRRTVTVIGLVYLFNGLRALILV